eukprot:2485581-Pyramimonas_sp.AAC.2
MSECAWKGGPPHFLTGVNVNWSAEVSGQGYWRMRGGGVGGGMRDDGGWVRIVNGLMRRRRRRMSSRNERGDKGDEWADEDEDEEEKSVEGAKCSERGGGGTRSARPYWGPSSMTTLPAAELVGNSHRWPPWMRKSHARMVPCKLSLA